MALSDGLVGYWSAWLGSSGYRLLDRARSNHGTLTNMDAGTDWVGATVQGRSGFALDFDGSNDYIDLVKQGALYRSGSISISAWIYRLGSSGTVASDYNAAGSRASFVLFIRSGKLEFFFESGGAVPIAQSSVDVPFNQWSHVCGTYDGTDRKVFINGVLRGSNSTAQSNLTQAEVGVTAIGRAGSFNGLYLNAQIADVAMHNRALTASEVQTLYNLGPGWYQPYRKRGYGYAVAAAGFKAYWHRRETQIIGGGLR
jgi:hypothetical protein